MDLMDRRGFLRNVVGGAAAVTIASSAGVVLLSNVAEAAPVPADKNLRKAMEDFAERDDLPETVQYWHGRYRRRHRRYWRRARRHCWWHRGVRRCRW
jgi:hypothetical protein